jgi:carbonic anhydrase/acetyltransferase-like protein (isoleucine patch superfamily)
VTKYKIGDKKPDIHATAFIANEATIIGDVRISSEASVWPGAVIRGDNEPIRIGPRTNIQEGAVLHADPGFALSIGDDVSVGHQAMLHGCMVNAGSLIGIQAIILNGAVIGRNCLVAAGAVVTEGKEFPDNSLILGAPAKAVRELSEEAIVQMHRNAAEYAERAKYYRENLEQID